MLNNSQYEQDCAEKFRKRWTSRKGVPLYPHGFGTKTTFMHEAINRRARYAADIPGTKKMIWRAYMGTRKPEWFYDRFLSDNIFSLYRIFPDSDIRVTYA